MALAPGHVAKVLGVPPYAKGSNPVLQQGERRAPGAYPFGRGALAWRPDGLLYGTTESGRQVYRVTADNHVELIASNQVRTADDKTRPADPLAPFDAHQGDGGLAADATLMLPWGLAFTPQGDLLVADTIGGRIRKLTHLQDSPRIEAFAGVPSVTLLQNFSAGEEMSQLQAEGRQAKDTAFVVPMALACATDGTVYVAEGGNVSLPMLFVIAGTGLDLGDGVSLPKAYARVRKIAPDGTVTTILGPGGKVLTDPTAEDALVLPSGLALAPDGRLAVVDGGSNRILILPAGSY
ncbi:MAG: Ricin lectin [Cyanobacteria bacterium RYN_339]|nr:Ricin lectin [Cyanobacteria bacterium RYN_339]